MYDKGDPKEVSPTRLTHMGRNQIRKLDNSRNIQGQAKRRSVQSEFFDDRHSFLDTLPYIPRNTSAVGDKPAGKSIFAFDSNSSENVREFASADADPITCRVWIKNVVIRYRSVDTVRLEMRGYHANHWIRQDVHSQEPRNTAWECRLDGSQRLDVKAELDKFLFRAIYWKFVTVFFGEHRMMLVVCKYGGVRARDRQLPRF